MWWRISLYLSSRFTPRGRSIREELRAEDAQYDANLTAAVDLALDEARSVTPPGRRPRVDVEDVEDVLGRPTFEGLTPGPGSIAHELRDRARTLDGDQAFDTDAFDAVHNPFRAILRPPVPPPDTAPDGLVEVILTGPAETVHRLAEAVVEAAGPSTPSAVSYRPARDGAAVRARFRITPPEADQDDE